MASPMPLAGFGSVISPAWCGLAAKKLEAVPRAAAVEDEEDAALSAFHSLCSVPRRAGSTASRIPRRSLAALGRGHVCKVCDQIRAPAPSQRGGGRVVAEAALAGLVPDSPGGFEQFIGREPVPEFVAMLAEEFQARLGSLPDESLRQVALWKPAGIL